MKTIRLCLCLLALAALAAPGLAQRAPNSTASSVTTTNAFLVRKGTVRLYDLVGQTRTNQDVYVMIFDRAAGGASLTNGSVPAITFLAFGDLPWSQSWPAGRPFNTGIVIGASSTPNHYTNCGPVLTLDANYLDGQ